MIPIADIRLQIRAESNQAQREIQALRREIAQLQQGLGQSQRSAVGAGQAVDRLGDEARESAVGVTELGRSIFRTSAEAKRMGGVFQGVDGRLREANGRFVKGREALQGFGRAAGGATSSTQTFTRSLGGLGNILGGLGIAVVGAQIVRFGTSAIAAAGQLEGFERGLRLIEGSGAAERLEQLIEVANLPGLNLTDLIQYSNRLRTLGLTAAETDTLLISTGQAITAFGGTAHTAAEATEQIIQAISSGTVSLQDFRSIAQRVPGFYNAIADVHGVSANIDGLRTAVENAGGSIKDALIPVMEELAVRFAAPPPESYAASIDELQNSFFLLQAEIGKQFLPVVGESVRALSTLFDALRENDLDALPEPIQAIVRGMQSLFDGFVSVGESIRSGLGPELDLLLPAIGNLLGDILSLAGALLNALAPAYEILAVPTRVAIALIVHLADTIGDVIGEITEFVDWVASLWQEEDRATASTQQLATAQGQLASAAEGARQATEGAAAAAQGASSAYDAWQQRIKDINAELDAHNERLERLQAQYQKNRENGIDPNSRSMLSLARTIETLGGETETFQQRVKDTEGALEALTQKLAQQEAAYQDYISQGSSPLSASMENLARNIKNTESQITALTPTLKENTEAADGTTESTNKVAKAVKEAAVEFITYGEAIRQVQANIAAYVEEQALFADFGDFWSVASGQVSEYSTAIDLATVSVVDHQTELETLLNAGFFDGLDDPIKDYVAALEATSEAADKAFGSINQVGEAVGDADFGAAAAELTDFDSAFQLSEATIPKVTSAMREFTGTAPDIEKVEEAVDQTTRSVDDLLNEVDRVPGEVEDAFSLAERSILGVLDQIPGFLIDIAQDDADITEAFGELGDRIGQSLIGELSGTLTDQIGAVITDAIAGADGAGAGGLGGAGAGIVSLLTSPVALAAIVPAAVFFATKYIGDQFGQTGTIDDPNRQGRPSQDDPLRRRGESQAAYEARIGVGAGVDPDDPTRTATRDGTRRIGTGASTPGSASVSEGRRRRGAAGEEPSPTSPFGRSTAEQPNLRALTDVQSAYIQSLGFDPSAYGYDSSRNAFVKTAQGNGPTLLYDASVEFDGQIPTATAGGQALPGSEAGVPDPTAAPRLSFAFTGDERATLTPYQTAVREAENAIEDLTEDSTPQEIADAYQALSLCTNQSVKYI